MSGIDSILLGYQRRAVVAAIRRSGFLLVMPTGSGKTLTTLKIIKKRYLRGQVDRVLVVCQETIIEQWKENILQWLPGSVVLNDPKEKVVGDRLAFFVTNYEKARNQLKVLRKCGFHMMVADECHKLKSRTSKQSRRLFLIGKSIPYKLGLTGTPVEDNELDFWAQARFVDSRVFGDTWGDFKDEWTKKAGFMGLKPKLLPERRQEFLDKMAEISFVVSDEESLGLPPIRDINIPIKLSPAENRAYLQMENDLVVRLGEVDIAAPMVVTQIMKLQQITGGFILDADRQAWRIAAGSSKAKAFRELLESHDKPLVGYARFLDEIDQMRLAAIAAGRKPSVIAGDDRSGDHRRFDVLLCQVGIVAGLDGMHHVADTGVFYSKPYSRIQYTQARGRLRRKGQKNQVKFYHLVVKNSIDTDMMAALQEKHDLHEAVVKHFLKRRGA